eukprot:11200228-Lingulodinium_polyedra.AAC.1
MQPTMQRPTPFCWSTFGALRKWLITCAMDAFLPLLAKPCVIMCIGGAFDEVAETYEGRGQEAVSGLAEARLHTDGGH